MPMVEAGAGGAIRVFGVDAGRPSAALTICYPPGGQGPQVSETRSIGSAGQEAHFERSTETCNRERRGVGGLKHAHVKCFGGTP